MALGISIDDTGRFVCWLVGYQQNQIVRLTRKPSLKIVENQQMNSSGADS